MTHPRSALRALCALLGVLPVLALASCSSCRKPPPPGDDAAIPVATSTPELVITPEAGEDAGDDADAEAGRPSGTRPNVSSNQAKIQACCNALRAHARSLGTAPERAQVEAAALQCDGFARQVGPGGNAPELATLRQIVAGAKLPGGCAL